MGRTHDGYKRSTEVGMADEKQESAQAHGAFVSSDHIIQFFKYEHLPDELQEVSKPFCQLAVGITRTLPRNPERTVALRKLLEAKDAAVRAYLADSA